MENDIKVEQESLREAVAVHRLLADASARLERENKRLWVAVMTLAIALMVMGGCLLWGVTNAQRLANEAVLNALNTVAEMEVTHEETTTTVTQDAGAGSGNNIYQQENGTYNERGGE